MRRDLWVLLGIVTVLAGLMLARGLGRTAPTPKPFSDAYTLQSAADVSRQTGRPVLVLATADWCGPCQALKRGALSDPGVAAYLSEHTVPVYLEDGVNPREIAALGVEVYPTTVILQNGEVLGVIRGGASAEDYLRTVRQSIEPGA